MKQMMRRLFALLMAVMMLCVSLPLNALAEIAPSDPIEEHSQGAWMYSALGDVAPISMNSDEDHVEVGEAVVQQGELDYRFEYSAVIVLYNDEVYDGTGSEEEVGGSVDIGEPVSFTIKVAYMEGHEDVLNGVLFSVNNSDSYEVVDGQINIKGQVLTRTYTYTVQPEDVYVTATIAWHDSEGDQDITLKIPVNQPMSLTVEKSRNGEPEDSTAYVLGEEIEYEITVTNESNVPVYNINVADDKTEFMETIESLPGTTSGGNTTATFTTTYKVTEQDIVDGEIVNTATATGKDPYGEDVMNSGSDATATPEEPNRQLTVEMTADPESNANLDDTITYTITVINEGNLTVSEITVTDKLTGLNDSSIGSLAPGESKEVTTTYTVIEKDILDGGDFENTATATGDSYDEKVTGVSDPVIVGKAPPAPELTVENAADKKSGAALGEVITYTVTVTNTGNVTVSDITVTDPLTELEKSVGTLAPGASAEAITTTYTVQEKDILEGKIDNTVTAEGTDSNGEKTTGTDGETVTTVAQAPALTVTKTADKTSGAAVNDVITYTINVTNSGNVTVSDITVTDPLTKLNESAGTLAPGESKENIKTTYTVTQTDVDQGSVENTATASGTDPNGGSVSNNGEVTVKAVEPNPILTVENFADKTSGAELNDVITYTITVTNGGNVTVKDITVTDPLTGLNQNIGTLAPGASAEAITTTYTVKEADILAGNIEDTATATGTNPKDGEVTGSGDATVTTVDAAPALTVTKTADKTEGAALNEEITYTITVTNSGNVTVKDITVTDPLTGLNQSVGTLAPGASYMGEIKTTYTVKEDDILAGKVENTATAKGTDPKDGEVTGSGSATVTTVDAAPALTVEKTADKTSGAELNDVITYTISVTNSGNVTVSDITVSDPLTELEKSVGTLAPGASTSVTTTHTIAESDILAGSFANTATAKGTDPNGDEVSGSDDATVTTVDAAPALTVVKSADQTGGALI